MKNTKVTKKEMKEKLEPLVASLLPDSDKKMGAIAGISLLVALVLCFWAAAYEVIIDENIFEKSDTLELKTTMNIIEKKEEKKETPKEQKKKEDNIRKRPGGGGKKSGKGNPKQPIQRGVLKLLTTQTKNASASVYDLMKNQKFATDIDKVIKNANGLQVNGKTKIMGERNGKINAGFNDGIAAGGSGGISDGFASLMSGSTGSIGTKALKGKLNIPQPSDIDMSSANSARSASDIMKVVRKRTPGLRHVYTKYLKKNPGFSGKVTLKFTISPSGEVINNIIVSSSTGYSDFDNEIKKTVSTWTFGKVKSGNTTVTIPFTFSE